MTPQGAGLGNLRWLKVAGEVAGSKEGVDWKLRRAKGKLAARVCRIDMGARLWVRRGSETAEESNTGKETAEENSTGKETAEESKTGSETAERASCPRKRDAGEISALDGQGQETPVDVVADKEEEKSAAVPVFGVASCGAGVVTPAILHGIVSPVETPILHGTESAEETAILHGNEGAKMEASAWEWSTEWSSVEEAALGGG